MKPVCLKWMLILTLALIIGFIVPVNNEQISFQGSLLSMAQALNQQHHAMDQSEYPSDFSGALFIRANLTPIVNYGFSAIKQALPSWGRELREKPSIISTGFFYPIMVILLFSLFYQTSRTSFEEDPFY